VRKSSGSETTFDQDHVTPEPIEAGVTAMADDVWTWCEKTGARARTVTVKIKWADFQQATRSRSLPSPVVDQDNLRAVSLSLIRSVFPPRMGVRLVGVTLSNFEAPLALKDEQLGLGLDAGPAPLLAHAPQYA
jgi:DNA polymerase-4